MCPVCLTTTLLWVTASVASTGGVSAVIVSRIRSKRTKDTEQVPRQKEQARLQSTTEARRAPWNI
jgi:hypothetical protein